MYCNGFTCESNESTAHTDELRTSQNLTMAAPNATTYLRVKRPRHVAPPSSLRVEGLEQESHKRARPNTVENLAYLLHQSTYIDQQQQHSFTTSNNTTASAAIWKRVETPQQHSKRPFHYVDAILNTVHDNQEGPQPKRRKLALTLVQDKKKHISSEETKPKKVHKNVILDPLSRLVQDSLQSVLSGERTVAQHLLFIATDGRVCDTPRVWLAWEDIHGGGGNILHAAALVGDAEGARTILSWNVPSLLTAVNGNHQTPYQVAVAVGHSSVAQVLEVPSNVDDAVEKEEDYVYDVFCLDKEMTDKSDEKEEEPLNVELRGGIGYWNENGDLILEALEEMQDDSSQNDEDDSNCEDHEGNDYPEEQEEEFWDSDEEEEISFRHRPIFMSQGGARVESRPTLVDEDEEYDAQYDLYEPSGPPRVYAYDPQLDESSNEG